MAGIATPIISDIGDRYPSYSVNRELQSPSNGGIAKERNCKTDDCETVSAGIEV